MTEKKQTNKDKNTGYVQAQELNPCHDLFMYKADVQTTRPWAPKIYSVNFTYFIMQKQAWEQALQHTKSCKEVLHQIMATKQGMFH